jgi:hypothetical protein
MGRAPFSELVFAIEVGPIVEGRCSPRGGRRYWVSSDGLALMQQLGALR